MVIISGVPIFRIFTVVDKFHNANGTNPRGLKEVSVASRKSGAHTDFHAFLENLDLRNYYLSFLIPFMNNNLGFFFS